MMDSVAGAGGSVAFFTRLDADRRAQIIGAVLRVALFLYREIVTEEGSFCSDVQLKPLQRSQLRYMSAHGGFADGHGVSEMIVAERVVALGTGVDVGSAWVGRKGLAVATFGGSDSALRGCTMRGSGGEEDAAFLAVLLTAAEAAATCTVGTRPNGVLQAEYMVAARGEKGRPRGARGLMRRVRPWKGHWQRVMVWGCEKVLHLGVAGWVAETVVVTWVLVATLH